MHICDAHPFHGHVQVLHRVVSELKEGDCWPMSESSQQGIDDMAGLTELHLEAMVHTCHLRYEDKKIYVSDHRIIYSQSNPTSTKHIL